jgi:hypothetical protein
LKPKIRGNLNQCPKMVPQNHTTKVLILQVKLCSRTMTEKAYFFGRMALWHQITRIPSKPHPKRGRAMDLARPPRPGKPRHDLLATGVHLSWPYSIGLSLASNEAT